MTMTPDERNRAIAEALEPDPFGDLQRERSDWKYNVEPAGLSPFGLYELSYENGQIAAMERDLHNDESAAHTLIDVMRTERGLTSSWHNDGHDDQPWNGYFQDPHDENRAWDSDDHENFCEAVALATSRALGIEKKKYD